MTPNTHDSESARALTGTWVVEEVCAAVKRGCRVLEIHEFYEYKVTRYDSETCEGGYFEGYIDTFLKLKARGQRLSLLGSRAPGLGEVRAKLSRQRGHSSGQGRDQ